jgi:hypothetical protein
MVRVCGQGLGWLATGTRTSRDVPAAQIEPHKELVGPFVRRVSSQGLADGALFGVGLSTKRPFSAPTGGTPAGGEALDPRVQIGASPPRGARAQ